MNFWHIQLHQNPNKRFTPAQLEEILGKLQVIGLGKPWKNKKGEIVKT